METVAIWGDIATWVTSIATIALFIIWFIQIRNERQARIKREKEEVAIKKRDQAEHISSWIVRQTHDEQGSWMWVAVLNQSTQPIYNVVVNIVALYQTGETLETREPKQACLDIVPPGQGYIAIEAMGFGHPGNSRAGVEIAFQDKSGISWLCKPDGELINIDKSPLEYCEVYLPTSWQPLSKDLPEDDFLMNSTPKKTSRRGNRSSKSIKS